MRDDVAVEVIHHHPENTSCDCCQHQMMEIGSKVAREEAKFIPARMMKVQHVEHTYECKTCKQDVFQSAQLKRGKAPHSPIQRSLAGPSIFAKVTYDKIVQCLPLYRQVKEWTRHGLETNDKKLSNWVIRATENWLSPIYNLLKEWMMIKSMLHVDKTYAQIIRRSDRKSGQTNAYNWVYRTVPSQYPIITLFQSSLSRGRNELESFIQNYKGIIVCDGYSAYGNILEVIFANCWAHARRYWLKADSKNGRIGGNYCDQLYRLERKFKRFYPSKRRKMRKKYSKPIVEDFFQWIDSSPFFGKIAIAITIAKAAEYTLKRMAGLRAFLSDGRIEIDNNPDGNAISLNVIGRKNWMHSVSEVGTRANAICLSLAETAKSNGIDFYEYLKKLLTDLPNLDNHQNTQILDQY